MLKNIKIEFIKLRHSSSEVLVFAVPLLVVIFNFILFTHNKQLVNIGEEQWEMWWRGIMAIWGYFMLPLYLTLAATLINSTEHSNNAWRLMLSLPISHNSLFFSKLIVVCTLVAISSLLLWVYGLMFIAIASVFGATLDPSLGLILLERLLPMLIASLPALIIIQTLSWYNTSIITPLAFGVLTCMAIPQVGSSEYWMYYPWSYMLIALSATDLNLQYYSIVLGGVLGVVFYMIASLFIIKKIKL